ncbi:MAG TPA: T9SS type A sorting domain-containing protein, partial [Bacteroidia bacterium]|nr:T9SS type A sorting domain-containing protein [Bacteroidia bacterium]
DTYSQKYMGLWSNVQPIVPLEVRPVSAVTSINNIVENTEVKIHPNPSSDGVFFFELKVNSEKCNVEVYNMLGEKIYSAFSIFNSPFSIDIKNQPAGIYLYRLVSDQGKLIGSGKLVIQ